MPANWVVAGVKGLFAGVARSYSRYFDKFMVNFGNFANAQIRLVSRKLEKLVRKPHRLAAYLLFWLAFHSIYGAF